MEIGKVYTMKYNCICAYKEKQAYCLEKIFLVFAMIPFLFPNPILITNIQPYAAVLGTFVLVFHYKYLTQSRYGNMYLSIAVFTFLISVAVLFMNDITMSALRAVYNYYAVMVIPTAVVISLNRLQGVPERLFKIMIIVWFVTATIQFFVYRGFLTGLISGVKWSYSYRGVVGLASEPSFLGITCFYFLHLVSKFQTKRGLYFILVLLMGVIYAQSATGIMFLGAYLAIFLLDSLNTRKGFIIWSVSIVSVIIFLVFLNTRMQGTRLYALYQSFMGGGTQGILDDGSANVRFRAITDALKTTWENWLLPGGYTRRIGSGYGGFLCELGIFSLPILFWISLTMTFTFSNKFSRLAYFIVITFLLLNNTQLGNPLLLTVMGTNMYFEDNVFSKRKIQSKIYRHSFSINSDIKRKVYVEIPEKQ